jgi:tetratricopeptide (TPR) repeat protein
LSANPRIEELRRRVQADPASIAFAALAEEYRRVGSYNDAIETCIAGLKRHPSYVSARVTLGRALIEVGRFDEAEQELQLVLKAAPENLAAIRGLADIHHRRPDQGYDELSKLAQRAANEESAAAATAAAQTAPASEPPPADQPVAPASTADEAPVHDTPAYQSPISVAPVDESPQYDTPQYDPPRYDPPGTFDLAQFAAAPASPAPVAVEERRPDLEALEQFLSAVIAARETVRAR